ncbi:uncharacterized protein EV420DRAFT_1480113 [Desarmillaria tabescens]|uniref:Uncharacterized protein n=1 Tax=Armillaria tabescens TaxID=1929756 RepID=A0AA39KBB7_ARMTA|nr:uncharacterized protein EV420DRAFT_1480113 [Desarmillaria tabescens]KAK0457930.1 hypothetical protein EV420DRAFT_1480113 [Desarmillaria tabescens]
MNIAMDDFAGTEICSAVMDTYWGVAVEVPSYLVSYALASVALVQPSETGHGLQLSRSWNTSPFTTLALMASNTHVSTPTTVRTCKRHDDRHRHTISYNLDQTFKRVGKNCPITAYTCKSWKMTSSASTWRTRYCLNLDNLVLTSDVKPLTARIGAATSQHERLSIQDCFIGAAISDMCMAHHVRAVGLVVPSWGLMPVPTPTPTSMMIHYFTLSGAAVDAFAFVLAIPLFVLNNKDRRCYGGVDEAEGAPKVQVPEGGSRRSCGRMGSLLRKFSVSVTTVPRRLLGQKTCRCSLQLIAVTSLRFCFTIITEDLYAPSVTLVHN